MQKGELLISYGRAGRGKVCFALALVWSCMLLLSACGTATSPQSAAPAAAATATATPALTSATTRAVISPRAVLTTPAATTVLPSPTATSSVLPQDWQTRWLKNIPCRAPCWEGITPGLTTIDQAIKLLTQNPLVNSKSIKRVDPLPEIPTRFSNIYWDNKGGMGITGKINFSSQQAVFTVISVSPGFTTYYKLGDIIRVYGEPDYISTSLRDDNGPGSLHVMWLSHGFILSSSYPKVLDVPTLSSNLLLGGVDGGLLFFIPTKIEDIGVWTNMSFKMFVPWQGYKDFYFYCRVSWRDAAPCR